MRLKTSDIGKCWDFQMERMRALKNLGFNPKSILDIGAYHGSWSEVMWHIWPDSKFHLIEADEDCIPHLKATGFDYNIALLSDKVEEVPFYKCQTGSGEGNSMFKENSIYPFTETKKQSYRLKDMAIPFCEFIKVDAQGAELRIINGGVELFKAAHVIQLECQIQSYNEGAPHAIGVINYMDKLGFRIYDISEYHYNRYNMLLQADFVFVRKDSSLFGLKVLT